METNKELNKSSRPLLNKLYKILYKQPYFIQTIFDLIFGQEWSRSEFNTINKDSNLMIWVGRNNYPDIPYCHIPIFLDYVNQLGFDKYELQEISEQLNNLPIRFELNL